MMLRIEVNLQLVPLRELTAEVIAAVNAFFRSKTVTEFLPVNAHTSLDDTEAFLKIFLEEGNYLWLIELHGVIIGLIDLMTNSDGSMNLAYVIDEEYWGQGIGGKVVAVIVEHAFESMRIDVINAPVICGNIGSEKVLTKNGFTVLKTMEYKGREAKVYQRKK